MSIRYLFSSPLLEATIVNRPNRFTAYVELEGKIVKTHTPVSGRIGGLTLDGLPCLLSGPYPNRGTAYTVEAVGLFPKDNSRFQWIGINQTRVNGVVEHFLKSRRLDLNLGEPLSREVKLASRRIDFRAGSTWLEVKMPLLKIHASREEVVPMKEFPPLSPSHRLPAQLGEMIATGERSVLLACFQYANDCGTSLQQQFRENIYPQDLAVAVAGGLEVYSAEFSLDSTGIDFVELHKFDRLIP